MDLRRDGTAIRLMLALAAGAALSGCAVYGPPYTVYDPAPAVSSSTVLAAPYYYNPYGYGYGYGRPAYVGPPISLNFGYYEHRYRSGPGWRGAPGYRSWQGYRDGRHWHGGPRWRSGPGWGGGPGWHGTPGWRGHGWSDGRGGGGRPGGFGGYRGGGRGHR